MFLLDFGYPFFKSKNKLSFFKKNYIDFFSSLPAIPYIKILRVTKVFKVFKLIRGFKEIKPILKWLENQKTFGVLLSYITILLIIVFYASLLFFNAEHSLNTNINTLFDSFWWAFITLTSVGYGDVFPLTTFGRIIAIILTLVGMGFFSIVTAEISIIFMKIVKNKDKKY